MGINSTTDTIYVAHLNNHTVSVIPEAVSEITHIKVGKTPTAIDINQATGTVYVANLADDTVSVIDGLNNTKIGNDIKVG